MDLPALPDDAMLHVLLSLTSSNRSQATRCKQMAAAIAKLKRTQRNIVIEDLWRNATHVIFGTQLTAAKPTYMSWETYFETLCHAAPHTPTPPRPPLLARGGGGRGGGRRHVARRGNLAPHNLFGA